MNGQFDRKDKHHSNVVMSMCDEEEEVPACSMRVWIITSFEFRAFVPNFPRCVCSRAPNTPPRLLRLQPVHHCTPPHFFFIALCQNKLMLMMILTSSQEFRANTRHKQAFCTRYTPPYSPNSRNVESAKSAVLISLEQLILVLYTLHKCNVLFYAA